MDLLALFNVIIQDVYPNLQSLKISATNLLLALL